MSRRTSLEPTLTVYNYGTLNPTDPEKVSSIDVNKHTRTSIEKPPFDETEKPNLAHFRKTLEQGNTTFWSKSMLEKRLIIQYNANRAVRSISVEPYLLLSILNFAMSSVVSQNLALYKFCVNDFMYPDDVCMKLKNNETLEKIVQKKATDFQLYKTLVTTLPTIILVLFLGSWSDKNGRKFLMLVPCVGGFLSNLINIGNVIYMKELGPYYLLLSEIPVGLTGSMACITLSSVAYIIDTSTADTRTIRLALMQASMMCGAPIGIAIGGVLFSQLGYLPVFSAGAVLNIGAFIYVLFVVKETIVSENKTFREKFCTFFDLSNIRDGFKTCLKKRELNGRVHIICLIIAMMINILPIMAEMSIAYYYVRLKFHWEVDTYSYYTTTVLFCSMIGLLFFLPLFTKCKMPDVYIGIIGACSKVCSELVMALATEGWMAFAASPIVVFGGLNSPIVRSMLSKCVRADEQGKVMSVVSAFESGMPIVGSAVYTQVYNNTQDTFPGTFYVISAVLCLIPVSLFVWISKDLKRRQKMALNSVCKPTEETYVVHL